MATMTALKRLRLDRGWSQSQTISRMVAASKQTLPGFESLKTQLSRWENGRCTVSPFYLQLLARVYDVSTVEVSGVPVSAAWLHPRRANASIYGRVFAARPALV